MGGGLVSVKLFYGIYVGAVFRLVEYAVISRSKVMTVKPPLGPPFSVLEGRARFRASPLDSQGRIEL